MGLAWNICAPLGTLSTFFFNPVFQVSTAKNEINLFNNHILIVAPVTLRQQVRWRLPWNSCLISAQKCRYGKCPKISNTLKFRTPNIFGQNNFWKCPKISNSSSFAKRGFLKFRTQLSSSIFFFYRHILISVTFFFFVFFFSVTEPETKVIVLKATAKRKCTRQCHNEFYVHKWHGNRILILYRPKRYWLKIPKTKKRLPSQC